MKLPSRGRRVNKTTQWVVFSQSRERLVRGQAPTGVDVPRDSKSRIMFFIMVLVEGVEPS